MSILSVTFLLFVAGLLIVYYLVPKKIQWCVLLAASMLFYCLGGWRSVGFVIGTALVSWACALGIQKKADAQKAYLKEHKADLDKAQKDAYKTQMKRSRRRLLMLCLVFCVALLAFFKYTRFLLAQFGAERSAFGIWADDAIRLLLPLGISFYTFQTVGYVVDVYWGKVKAERNPLKVLLFTSFFPQITQGPISTWSDLACQLFAEHRLDYTNYVRGAERMIWGFFKKMVVANIVAGYVKDVFTNYPQYAGLTALAGAFYYSVQIYADFSGYMDIVCGLCQMLGIRLTENFDRPYFSKSVAEYWRRWHSSLGAWFKTYIYYPIAVSRWNQRLGKWAKQRLGKAFGDYLPATLALVLVWFTTGLWHGASWAYIAWGGVNGLFIIVSMWMERPFAKVKNLLHINESAWLWRAFQVLRTFILVTFIKVLPEVGTLRQGLGLWKRIFTEHTIPASLGRLLPFATDHAAFFAAAFGVVLMFAVSLLQRKGSVRELLERRVPYVLRLLLFAVLFFLIVYFGVPASGGIGGFLYAQF